MSKTPTGDTPAVKAVPLAIVGIGCLFPKAADASSYWHNIRDGVDAIGDIPDSHWKPEDYFDPDKNAADMTYARRGGFIEPVDFDPLLYGLSPNNIEATDSTQLLGMVVARQALLDAGYATARDSNDGRQFDRDRTSVILGVTGTLELVIPLGARLGHPVWRKALADAGVDKETAEDVVQRIADGYVPWQENSFPGLLGNVAAGRIANRFDLGGTNCVVDAACASSLSAVHMAAMELYAGRADMAITGGFDTFNDIFMYMCFSKTPALSPTGNSKPFDLNGDGTILGEGLGAIILKRLDDARRDGDKVYAVIRGIGSSSDGRGNAIYAPSAEGQTRALKNAYQEAGVSPDTIELVEAHGTGTKVGDAVEAQALSGVYREARKDGSWCAIGSVKSMIGHTKAAAGVAGLIKIALALQHRVLPPTIKVEQPLDLLQPGQAPVYINGSKRPWISDTGQPRRAALSAFGFGGSNFHCVLEEVEQDRTSIDWDGEVLLFAFSADEVDELRSSLTKTGHDQDWSTLRAEASRSLQSFDSSQPLRLCLVVTRLTNLEKLLTNTLGTLQKQAGKNSWSIPDGACFAAGTTSTKLAMLFPGQGSQYTDMLLDLACQFPQMQESLARAQRIKSEQQGGDDLNRLIYPITVFSDEARQENENSLRLTQHAQPAIGACSIGARNILQHFGIHADATAGHSFGELTALCAAGVIAEEDLHRLANRRGELMQAKDGDHGAMLAVSASAAVVHEFLEAEPLDLIIANNNAPTQVVLSGATRDIDLALARFSERGVSAKKLPVSAAFHSIYVSDAEKPFAAYLQAVDFQQSDTGVYANSSSELYPAEADSARALLAGQLAKPVEFVTQIENMYAAGIRTFVEVGPGKILSTLVKAILGDREHHALALDASRGARDGQYDLACLLAQLSVLGHDVEIEKWDADYLGSLASTGPEKRSTMTISVSGANFVKPRPASEPVRKKVQGASAQAGTDSPPQHSAGPSHGSKHQLHSLTSADNNNDALRATQQSILALQKMQEQTAQLHKQYLESQERAQQNIQQLMQQQQDLLTGGPVMAPAVATTAAGEASPVLENVESPAADDAETPGPVTADSPAVDSVQYESLLLEVVSDKTGYPVDMLSMDMSLDTDLGIDSIKRVEILSALQERLPGAARVEPEDLGTFQMLKHIVEFLADGESTAATMPGQVEAPAIDSRLEEVLLEVVADKTGYPVDMLNLDMNMDTDLGIDSIKRVEILSGFQEKMPEAPTVNPEDLATLHTLQQIVDFMQASTATTAAPAITPTATAGDTLLQDVLLEVVADKTGYPVDMLNLDMNMDTDLGIDSIKRVEILSGFQEKMPEAPAVNPEDLATLHTLQQIIDFMQANTATTTVPAVTPPTATAGDTLLQDVLLEVVADKTGYPVDMLNLDMNMDTDLGIDSIKRVEILSGFQEKMPEAPAVNPEDLATLHTLQQIVDHMTGAGEAEARPESTQTAAPVAEDKNLYRSEIQVIPLVGVDRNTARLADNSLILVSDDGTELPGKICKALAMRNLRGEIISMDSDIDPGAAGLIILTPVTANSEFLLGAFDLLKRASSTLRQAVKDAGAVLIGVTRLGGAFGIEHLSKANPVSGGLTGLIKTADKEWNGVHCRAIDIPANRCSAKLAAMIIEEALKEGPLEAGIDDNRLVQLRLNTGVIETGAITGNPFSPEDLVIITGGARGVTAEVAVAIAQRYQCNLLLLGRSPMPEAEPGWLTVLEDEAAIKKALIEHSENEKPSPAMVEDEYRRILADREIRRNIQRIQDSGARVLYQSVDIRQKTALSDVISNARSKPGNIAGIIHGAGVLADRLIEDKTAEQFRHVYSTKVDGLQNLLDLCGKDRLKTLVLFSSSTARFGRKGQADYAVANEVLNKIAQQQQLERPDCRVLSVNWGPWDGGMVTPQLRKLFESEGVGVIPLKAGADYLLQEIAGNGPVEIVVLGSEPDEPGQHIRSSTRDADLHLVIERRLNLRDYPVLKSHVMNHRAVLPAALIAEWLAHAAMHNHPGLSFIGFNDLRILKGVVLEAEEEIELQLMAGQTVMDGEEDRVHIELRSGQTLHASAEVILSTNYPQAGSSEKRSIDGDFPCSHREYYSNGQLFHGPALQSVESISACSAVGISGQASPAPLPATWMTQPMRSTWLADPMVLDAGFQMMILWSFQQKGMASLPTRVAAYRQYQRQFPKESVKMNVYIDGNSQHTAKASMDMLDMKGKLVARIEGYECVIDDSLKEAFLRNSLEQAAKI